MKRATSLIHTKVKERKTGSIVSPIHLSTVFAMSTPSSSQGFQYGRVGNPTRATLERTLASLYEAKSAVTFSSGSAAISMLPLLLQNGDEILCHDEQYEGSSRIFKLFERLGIRNKKIDMRSIKNVEKAISEKTKMIFFESPTNPTLQILDIKKIADEAHKKGVFVVVDNTLASPILQQPLSLGADIVVESISKAINGHSDVIAGVIALQNKKLAKRIRNLQHNVGAILHPFDCFLILRSLKTLPIRVKQQQTNAQTIVTYLRKHPKIGKVFFPQKKDIEGQMEGQGFIVSFVIKADKLSGTKFVKKLKLIIIGHSFGGVETLIQQPTKMMDLSLEERNKFTDNFFRLSVGIEDVDDIIFDLDQALNML